jgi:hypothetical protein
MRKTLSFASILTSLLMIALSAGVSIWVRSTYPVTAYAPPHQKDHAIEVTDLLDRLDLQMMVGPDQLHFEDVPKPRAGLIDEAAQQKNDRDRDRDHLPEHEHQSEPRLIQREQEGRRRENDRQNGEQRRGFRVDLTHDLSRLVLIHICDPDIGPDGKAHGAERQLRRGRHQVAVHERHEARECESRQHADQRDSPPCSVG